MPSTFYETTGIPEILSSSEFVSFGSDESFEKAAKDLIAMNAIPDPPQLSNQLVAPLESLSEEDKFNWFFLMDLINFHFYYENGKQYSVTYKGQTFVGSMGLAAAINRWLEINPKAVQPETLAAISMEEFKKILRDDSGVDVPMVEDRFAFVKSSYPILLEKNQSFLDAIIECKFSPKNILNDYLLKNFPNFCDESNFNGQKIKFNKRAQLLVKDILTNCSESATKRGFKINYDYLSIFADYRVPQILRHYGLILYSKDLETAIKNGFLENSKMEIEIRAFSLAVGERLREMTGIPAAIIDTLLWKKRRMFGSELDEEYPFHKYFTTAY